MASTELQRCIDWLKERQGELETAGFGQGKIGVHEALLHQRQQARDIHNYRNTIDDVLGKEDVDSKLANSLTGNYQSVQSIAQTRNSCFDLVKQISDLEDSVQNLSCEFDARAVHLVNTHADSCRHTAVPKQKPSNESLARTTQNCISAVRHNWRGIMQHMQCAEVHMRNAAAYQQFFQEVQEAEHWMDVSMSRIHSTFDKNGLNGNRSNAITMTTEMREVLAAFLQWQTKIDYLYDRARDVVPVPQRSSAITEPRPVTALADFSSKEVDFIEGETLTLVDNTDRYTWKVKTSKGQEGVVPAVIILIPAPHGPAFDAASSLRLQLLALWTTTVKKLGYQLIAFMLLVFRQWTKAEIALLQAIPQNEKDEILKLLEDTESSLVPIWEGYTDFQKLQDRMKCLRNILNEAPQMNGHGNGDSEPDEKLVIQFKMLDNLMKNYKDFWTFWESFKCVVEMMKQPKFLLVCDKWEELRFVTSAHFVRFWDIQLDLDKQDGVTEEVMVKEDLVKSESSLVVCETPQEEMPFNTEMTIEEEVEETITDTVTSHLEEEQHTFIITGVLDPRDNKTKLSLDEAISLGIVDQNNNSYKNPKTGEVMSMSDAMNEGRIIMDFVSKKKIREEQNSYGLITIKVTKEMRPYTIKAVLDPVTEKKLTVPEATSKHILDANSNTYITEQGEKISIMDAIHSGLVFVEYHGGDEVDHHADVITKTYSVHGVVDQLKKKKVSFNDAVRDGLLDKDTGEYINNETGQKVGVQEAIMKGFIKARVVTDPSKLDANPDNTIVVEKFANAKNRVVTAVKAMKAFKSSV